MERVQRWIIMGFGGLAMYLSAPGILESDGIVSLLLVGAGLVLLGSYSREKT